MSPSQGFGDAPKEPRYIIDWIEYGLSLPRKAYKGTVIYLPRGVEGWDEQEVASEVGTSKEVVKGLLRRKLDSHKRAQATAHYREDLPLG